MPVEVPQFHELFNPTLKALHDLGGSAGIGEIASKVIENERYRDEVTNEPHGDSNTSELEYRLHWARSYLKDAGYLENSSRGVWTLTPLGRSTNRVDSVETRRKARKEARKRREAIEQKKPPHISTDDQHPENDPESWRDQLRETLLSLDPAAFERLCQRMLRESGFIEVTVTGRSGDGGIDGNGIIRIGGLISFPVVFQAKRYTGTVSAGVVRDFRGAMVGRAEKGVIITTGGFTADARKEATRDGAPPIDLIDGDLLADKLKELGLGVRTKMVEAVEVDAEWFAKV